MPILAECQMKGIDGFGEFYIQEIKRLIQRHYSRGRLPTPEELIYEESLHKDALRKVRKNHGGRGKNQEYSE